MRQAWRDGFLAKPPALTGPADAAPRDRYITKAEARLTIEAARVTPHVYVFAALAFWTGARKGSIQALKWDRVDFQQGVIDFQSQGASSPPSAAPSYR